MYFKYLIFRFYPVSITEKPGKLVSSFAAGMNQILVEDIDIKPVDLRDNILSNIPLMGREKI